MSDTNYFIDKEQHQAIMGREEGRHTGEADPMKISPKSYAYGIWLFNVNAGSGNAFIDGIYRDGFLALINGLGYFKRYKKDNTFQYIKDVENIIHAVEVSQIRDEITNIIIRYSAIKFDFAGLTFEATAEIQKEKFFRNSPSLFTDAILGHLPNHDSPVLHDVETEMYFPFQNCIASVTDERINIKSYADLKGVCIWKDHIIKQSLTYVNDFDTSQYAKFISNVSLSQDDRVDAFRSAIGYLLHNYSSPTKGRAVIAYDEQVAGKREPAGGTGKGIFGQAINILRHTAIIDGKKINDKSPFSYQAVTERSQVIFFDDVRPDFDFLTLNSNLTQGWQIEHKNKPSFRFEPIENPKTYITSNTILNGEGTTAERRRFIIEFSNHYSKLAAKNIEPIIHEHGSMFFTPDWSNNEWNKFLSFMLDCSKYYLNEGLRFYNLRAVNQNKLMQKTSDDFSEWIKLQDFAPEQEFDISEMFREFKATYYGEDSEFKQRTFTNWLKTFALTKKWELKRFQKGSGNQKNTYGKMIIRI